MSVITKPPASSFQPPPYPISKFTVAGYHELIQLGIFTEDDSVELLEGWIVPKMGHNPPHDGTVALNQDTIGKFLPPGWHLRVQSAITTSDSEPEPDLVVARGSSRDYMSHHPGPQNIALVIEVADTTLASDRQHKGRLYARAGLPNYWIINLIDSQVEVYSDPTGPDPEPSYRQRRDYDENGSVPLLIDGKEIAQIPVRGLLP